MGLMFKFVFLCALTYAVQGQGSPFAYMFNPLMRESGLAELHLVRSMANALPTGGIPRMLFMDPEAMVAMQQLQTLGIIPPGADGMGGPSVPSSTNQAPNNLDMFTQLATLGNAAQPPSASQVPSELGTLGTILGSMPQEGASSVNQQQQNIDLLKILTSQGSPTGSNTQSSVIPSNNPSPSEIEAFTRMAAMDNIRRMQNSKAGIDQSTTQIGINIPTPRKKTPLLPSTSKNIGTGTSTGGLAGDADPATIEFMTRMASQNNIKRMRNSKLGLDTVLNSGTGTGEGRRTSMVTPKGQTSNQIVPGHSSQRSSLNVNDLMRLSKSSRNSERGEGPSSLNVQPLTPDFLRLMQAMGGEGTPPFRPQSSATGIPQMPSQLLQGSRDSPNLLQRGQRGPSNKDIAAIASLMSNSQGQSSTTQKGPGGNPSGSPGGPGVPGMPMLPPSRNTVLDAIDTLQDAYHDMIEQRSNTNRAFMAASLASRGPRGNSPAGIPPSALFAMG